MRPLRILPVAVLSVAVLLLGGCSDSEGPVPVDPTSNAPSSASPTQDPPTSSPPAPLESNPQKAAAALEQVSGPGGLEPSEPCSGSACLEGIERARWVRGVTKLGRPIPQGRGTRERAYAVLAGWPNEESRDRWLDDTGRGAIDRYDGPFDIALRQINDTQFQPGRRGRGTVADVEVDGWTGRVADYRESLSFSAPPRGQTQRVRTHLLYRDSYTLLLVTVAVSPQRHAAFERTVPELLNVLNP